MPTVIWFMLRIPLLSGLLAICVLMPLPAAAQSAFAEAAGQLNGQWRDEELVLKIDSMRAQASLDAARPFEWRRFLIKSVSGGKVVFTVGPDLFEATLAEDTITLTGTTFRGERTLRRHEPSLAEPGTPSKIEPGFRGSED